MLSYRKPMEKYAAIASSSHSKHLAVNFCALFGRYVYRLLSARLGVLSYVRTIESASLHVLYHTSASYDLAPKCRSIGGGGGN